MSQVPPSVSVVIPAFNEEQRLGSTLQRCCAYLEPRAGSSGFEIVVVDDGSTDTTAAVAAHHALEHEQIRCLSYRPNRGKGYAVRTGMLEASGTRCLLCDADLSTPVEELELLDARLDDGADIAIGSRSMPDSIIVQRQPLYREYMGRTFNHLVRALGLSAFKDTQCGFKLFTAEAARELFSRAVIDGFAFDVEILALAQGRFRIDEVPVRWAHQNESRVAIGSGSASMAYELFRILLRQGRRR